MDKQSAPSDVRYSYANHRKQTLYQIVLPVALAAALGVLAIVLIALATFNNNTDVERWAAISTIWLVLPVMALMLLGLAVLLGLNYGLYRLLKMAPRYTGIAQDYVLHVAAQIMLWTDRLIQPVLHLKSWLELLSNFFGHRSE